LAPVNDIRREDLINIATPNKDTLLPIGVKGDTISLPWTAPPGGSTGGI